MSLTNSTLLLLILLPSVRQIHSVMDASFPFPHEDMKSSANTKSFLSPLTLSTAPKSNIRLTNSHSLQGDLKFYIPNLMNIFIFSGRSKETVPPFPRRSLTFRCRLVPSGELQGPGPDPIWGDHALTALDDSLFNVVPAALHT